MGVPHMSTAPHQKSDDGVPAAVRSCPDTRTSRAPSAPIEWPVGVVADWLGIPASTLRTWERRYGLGPSDRTRGGHRRYTEQDVTRVQAMQRLMAQGASVSSAARTALSIDEVRLRFE